MGQDRKIVLCPGPVHLHSSVIEKACSAYHRTDSFRNIFRDTEKMIRGLLGTDSPVYLLAASGTGAMEASIVNITERGSRVLVISGGKFGDRWKEICEAYNCHVDLLSLEPGSVIEIGPILERIEEFKPDVVTITHVESSTGGLFPLREFTEGFKGAQPLLIVDAIASLGAEELRMDEWGIDVVVSAGQKALAACPGISLLSLGRRALELSRKSARKAFYFDLKKYESGREIGDAPYTPAIQGLQTLHHSLLVQSSAGWEEMRERHRRSAEAVVSALEMLKLDLFAEAPSSAVQVMVLPDCIDGNRFIEQLSEKFGVVVAGGQGFLSSKVIRIGFTGLYSGEMLNDAVIAVGELLEECGVEIDSAASELRMRPLLKQKMIF